VNKGNPPHHARTTLGSYAWRAVPLRCLLEKHAIEKGQGMANASVGERFPAFVLPDEQRKPFELRSELAEGPLMLVFYRGDW